MIRKIITTSTIAILGGLCLGASCQKAADSLSRAGSSVGIPVNTSSGNSSDVDKGIKITKAVVETANQNWNDEDIGQSVAVSLTARPGLDADTKLNDYVTSVGLIVASVTGRSDIDFTFGILNGTEANAISAPRGYIFITRGALSKMQDESELAGVLAHEIAHVVKDHGMDALRQKRGTNLLVKIAATAADNQMFDVVSEYVGDIIDIVYNPAQENDADALAVTYLKAANYDPTGLERFVSRELASAKPDLRSHPPTATRIAKLKAAAGANPTGQKNAERFKSVVTK